MTRLDNRLDNKVLSAFSKIQAEDALKQSTAAFLSAEIQKRSQKPREGRTAQQGSAAWPAQPVQQRQPARSARQGRPAWPMRQTQHPRPAQKGRFAVACAALVLLAAVSLFSYRLYFTPTSYVDMDVNPSIELTLNCFGRVIDADSYNEDGAAILQGIEVRHKSYDEAVRVLLDAMFVQGYLEKDGLVSITAQASDIGRENELLAGLWDAVDKTAASHHVSVTADIFAVTAETRGNAHAHGVSPAKYLAIEQLIELDPTVTFEGCEEHSIGEIRQLTDQHSQGHHGGASANPPADDAQGTTLDSGEEQHSEPSADEGQDHGPSAPGGNNAGSSSGGHHDQNGKHD